jgi:hypothetical protein
MKTLLLDLSFVNYRAAKDHAASGLICSNELPLRLIHINLHIGHFTDMSDT